MDSAAPLRISYGESPEQRLECWDASSSAPRRPGIIVLIHGGYWRPDKDLTLMNPLVRSLTAAGWPVVNMEYRRRGSRGEWPRPLQDVLAGLDAVRTSAFASGRSGPIITIGHSVGGLLALLSAEHADAVVALAPVTDCARTDRERLGDDAAYEYFDARASESPEIYESASPIRQLPSGRPVLLVHGTADARVPIEHSQDYARAATDIGDEVALQEVPGVEHLTVIDPGAAIWLDIETWIAQQRSHPSHRLVPEQ